MSDTIHDWMARKAAPRPMPPSMPMPRGPEPIVGWGWQDAIPFVAFGILGAGAILALTLLSGCPA